MDQVAVRQLAKCMVYNTGVWWLDLFGHGWFNYDSFWTTSKNATALMAKYGAVKKQSTPEVCLILDESAMSLAGNARVLGANLLQSARTSLYTSGYRFGTYLIDDLISGKIDDAKVYVMLTPWRLNGSDAAALKSRLQRPGKVTLWMYGNGLTSAADFKALTGMTISSAKQSSGYAPQFELASGLAAGMRNSAVPVNPVYYVEAVGGVQTLGAYNGGAAAGKAGFASYTKDGWTSVFYGGLTVSEDLLAYAAGLGKAHAFAPRGDVVYSDGQMVSMHVKTSGNKTFTFPSSCDIYNPQTKAWSAGKTVTINGAKRGQTILLFYGKKSELQTVAN